MLLIGAVDAQGLLAEGGAGRAPSTTTAAAGLPAILLLIGADGSMPPIATTSLVQPIGTAPTPGQGGCWLDCTRRQLAQQRDRRRAAAAVVARAVLITPRKNAPV